MGTNYAHGTSMTTSRRREAIEELLRKAGASAFSYGWENHVATLAFTLQDRQIRYRLPLPKESDAEFQYTPTGRWRSEQAAASAWSAAVRQRWAVLELMIKAKLAAVEAGVTTLEEEFLAQTTIPGTGGRTVYEFVQPELEAAYRDGSRLAIASVPA